MDSLCRGNLKLRVSCYYNTQTEDKHTYIFILPSIVAHNSNNNVVDIEGQGEHAAEHSRIVPRPRVSWQGAHVYTPRVAFDEYEY